MKTTIYMIRHGQSVGNARRDFLGHTDLPITKLGEEQALSAGAYLASIGFSPDAVYASPLCRAAKTTELALSQIAAPAPVYLDGLREIFAGEWENKSFGELDEKYPEERYLWHEDIGHACPVGGEAVKDLYGRVVSTVLTLAKKHEGQTIFIGTHATPIRATETYARGMSADMMATVPWPTNASLSVYTFDGERLLSVAYSYDDFLKSDGEEKRLDY